MPALSARQRNETSLGAVADSQGGKPPSAQLPGAFLYLKGAFGTNPYQLSLQAILNCQVKADMNF